jgi:hypothetical protein
MIVFSRHVCSDYPYFLKGLAIIVYRIWFHPLAKFPGPVLAKVTNLYGGYYAWRGDLHLDMMRCHEKYGWKQSSYAVVLSC